jgi:hypothetical protein
MTAADIDDAMGWPPGTARRLRWEAPELGGLPDPDAQLGNQALWFRITVQAWRATYPGAHLAPTMPANRSDVHEPPDPGQPADDIQPIEDAQLAAAAYGTAEVIGETDTEADESHRDPDVDQAAPYEPHPDEPHPDEPHRDEPQRDDAAAVENEASDETVGALGAEVLGRNRGEPPADSTPISSGFQVPVDAELVAWLHAAWRRGRVVSRGQASLMLAYDLGTGPLAQRQQRVSIDRVRLPRPTP